MQKTKFTVYLSPPVAASVEALMAAEDRTFSNVVERVLKAALAEPDDSVGVAQWKERSPGKGQPERKDGSSSLPSDSSGSASADRIAAAGTNGKSSHTDSPPVAAATKRGQPRRAPADVRVAAAAPRSKCKDPNHGRKGWKCRGCGEMF